MQRKNDLLLTKNWVFVSVKKKMLHKHMQKLELVMEHWRYSLNRGRELEEEVQKYVSQMPIRLEVSFFFSFSKSVLCHSFYSALQLGLSPKKEHFWVNSRFVEELKNKRLSLLIHQLHFSQMVFFKILENVKQLTWTVFTLWPKIALNESTF